MGIEIKPCRWEVLGECANPNKDLRANCFHGDGNCEYFEDLRDVKE